MFGFLRKIRLWSRGSDTGPAHIGIIMDGMAVGLKKTYATASF